MTCDTYFVSADENDGSSDEEDNSEAQELIPAKQSQGGLADFKARLEGCKSGWVLLLSIPKLFMLAHLQHLMGVAQGGGRSDQNGAGNPSIKPNEYMDNLLVQITTSMNER